MSIPISLSSTDLENVQSSERPIPISATVSSSQCQNFTVYTEDYLVPLPPPHHGYLPLRRKFVNTPQQKRHGKNHHHHHHRTHLNVPSFSSSTTSTTSSTSTNSSHSSSSNNSNDRNNNHRGKPTSSPDDKNSHNIPNHRTDSIPSSSSSSMTFPLLLIHGFASTKEMFDLGGSIRGGGVSFHEFLAKRGYDVYSVDLRGSRQGIGAGERGAACLREVKIQKKKKLLWFIYHHYYYYLFLINITTF